VYCFIILCWFHDDILLLELLRMSEKSLYGDEVVGYNWLLENPLRR